MRKPLCLLVLLLPASACANAEMCANQPVTRVEAPDHRHSAVLFQRDCGATTGFSTQVSILAPGEPLAGAGNAFVADDDHGAAVAGAWGGPWAELQWVAADHLLIRYAAKSRVFQHETSVSGVRISYQPDAR